MIPDLVRDLILLAVGGLISLVASLVTGVALYILEGLRERSREHETERHKDYRAGLRYAKSGRSESLTSSNLRGANWSFVDLSGCDLRDANLRDAHLYKSNLSSARLSTVIKDHDGLYGYSEANVKGADLSETIVET